MPNVDGKKFPYTAHYAKGMKPKKKKKKKKKPMSYEDALKKSGNDVTKIPGNTRGKKVI
jgi:hypothetical protein